MPYTPTNFSTTAVINADTLFQNYDDEVQVLMSDVGNYLTEEMVKVYTETETIVTDGIKVNSVETIEDLATQDGVVFPTIIVKDLNRGGTFIWSETGTANGGTVFAGVSGYWIRQYSGAVNVKWFGAVGDGVTDDTSAIQKALDLFGANKKGVIDLRNSKYLITSSLLIRRGKSIIGDSASEIIADFNSGLWGGDYVALKFIVDESPILSAVLDNTSQHSFGFTLTGKNNSTVVSYGMKFYTSFLIDVGVAINYSFLFGKISNVSIKKFDTAVYMVEVNSSSFNNLYITECRRGIYVAGKSVNVVINNIYVANATNTYTSSTAVTRGFEITFSLHYNGGVEGRPEGFNFNGGAIMSHANNLYLNSCLSLNFENVMLDLAVADSVVIGTITYLTIRGSYIFTSGVSSSCILFNAVSSGVGQNYIIESNYLVGIAANNTKAVSFIDGGQRRTNITIHKNKLYHTTGISAIQCPDYSSFCYNTSEGHTGTEFMYVQNGGANTTIDGNTCSTTSVRMLRTHPSVTSKYLVIGSNISPTYKTSHTGYIKLLAGQTTVAVPTYLGETTDYIRAVVTFVPQGNIGSFYFTPFTSGTSGTLTALVAPVADVIIGYKISAVPYTATLGI